MLGFNISSITAVSVTASNVINISGPNYISILSNALTKPVNNKVLYVNNSYSNVLSTIPVNVAPGDLITSFYQVSQSIHLSYKYTINATDIIDIKIVDDMGNILNLNGADIAIQLYFIIE